MGAIMIRKLIPQDIRAVMDIWISTNITAHDFIAEEYWEKNYDIVEKEYLPAADTYVYEEEQEIKGFISILNDLFVGGLFVDENSQGKGIGKALLNYVKEQYNELELCAYADNYKAVNFYKHCGFIVTEQQPNEDSGYLEYNMKWKRV